MVDRLTQCWRKLLFYLRRNRFDREMEEEMRIHLEMIAEENLRAGMSPQEARYAARRQFGNQALTSEVSREIWFVGCLEALRQDIRYGLRVMARAPRFTALVMLILALGIGISTAAFSIVDAVLLRPLPFRDPSRLVLITLTLGPSSKVFTPYRDLLEWSQQNRSFEGLAGVSWYKAERTLTGNGEPRKVTSIWATENFFSLLGAPAAAGRTFSSADLKDPRVVVLAHGFWQKHFGGAPDVVGKSLTLDDAPYTI